MRVLRQAAQSAAPLVIGLLILAALIASVAGPTEVTVGIDFLIAVVLATGMQIFCGNSGIISFGHIAFMGLGAYAAALVSIPASEKALQLTQLPRFLYDAHLPLIPAIVVGTAVAAGGAAMVGAILTRMRGDAMAMATLALLLIFYVVGINWSQLTNGATGVFGVPGGVTVWVALAFASIAVVIAMVFRYSRVGLTVRATREDEVAAAALGADVRRVRLLAWIVSCAVVGAGGALWGEYNGAFGPDALYLPETFLILSMLVIGGMSTVSGAVVGAAFVSLVNWLLTSAEAGTTIMGIHVHTPTGSSEIVIGVIIIVALRARPDGMVKGLELDARLRRWPRRRSDSASVAAPVTGQRLVKRGELVNAEHSPDRE